MDRKPWEALEEMSVSSNKWRRKQVRCVWLYWGGGEALHHEATQSQQILLWDVFLHVQPRSIDIFHPLARVDWEECGTIPASPTNVQCVYLNGKLHVGGHYLTDLFESSAQLFISSPDLSSWSQVDTPTGFYGLTTFHNRIVLVGGMKAPIDMDNEVFTNELWLSDDGSKWEQTIQPMSTPRFTPLVLNPGNPECIVVVGGGKGVEVFIDGQWSSVDPLPISCNDLFATLHNRNWFIRARALEYSNFVYCSVDSLVSAARGGSNRTSSTPGQQPLWKRLPVVLPDTLAPTSFYGELAIVEKFLCEEGKIYAFNPVSRALVHVADTPVPVGGAYNTPRLLLMEESYLHPGSFSADTELKVYKPVVSGMYVYSNCGGEGLYIGGSRPSMGSPPPQSPGPVPPPPRS